MWGLERPGDAGQVRTIAKNLRQKLGDATGNPRYILTEPRVVYRMPKVMSP